MRRWRRTEVNWGLWQTKRKVVEEEEEEEEEDITHENKEEREDERGIREVDKGQRGER